MKTSEKNAEIIKALVKTQTSIKTVSKDRQNPFANSQYATLDNILEEVKPILNENGIFLTQEPVTENGENQIKIGVITRLLHTSGEYIEYEPLFMILEKGAKMNMAQSAGSIITYAKRYSISAILGIATGDDTDGVHDVPTQNGNNVQQQPQNDFGNQRGELLARIQAVAVAKNGNPENTYKYILGKLGANEITPQNIAQAYKLLNGIDNMEAN